MSRLLLVSPTFHGYWKAIEASLEASGHDVEIHLYDELPSVSAKVTHKVRYELKERLGRESDARREQLVTLRAIRALRQSRADVVVVVKGDVLGDDFWAALGDRPRVLWLYDEIRRTRWTTRSLTTVGPICSYSRLDTETLSQQGLPVRYLPLAFDHRLRPHPTSRRTNEVVLIGARYPKRQQTMQVLTDGGIRLRAYGRDWSHHPWDRLRTWDLRRPDLPAGRDLSRGDAYDTMTSAPATLNIHHDQDGFTMRTFEACGVGAVQLIDRTDLGGLYDDGIELACYSSLDELVDLCRRVARDHVWADKMRSAARARTLAEHTFDHRMSVLAEAWA